MTESKTFDPAKYLTDVRGKQYLEVKWRLVWLRELHPDADVETELLRFDSEHCVVRARIEIPGGGAASGLGSETMSDWKDYAEKAETKAIGRALAALGFGTQFCTDHDFGATEGKVVDSPVERSQQRSGPPPQQRQNGNAKPTVQNPDAPASVPQLNFIRGLAKDCGYVIQGPDGSDHLDEIGFGAYVGAQFQVDWPNIPKGKASEIIEELQAERASRR